MTNLQEAEQHIIDALDAIVEEQKRTHDVSEKERADGLKNLRSKLASGLNDVRDLREV